MKHPHSLKSISKLRRGRGHGAQSGSLKAALILFAVGMAGVVRADFDPIPLTPGSYNADVIVERTAPPCIPCGYTASMDGGTNNNGNTWYELGYNTASPTTGLPPAGSTFPHASDANKQYTMPPSYTANNAILIDSRITTGTLTLTTPAILTSISILNSAGSGPLTVNYTVHHASSADETGSWSCLNWFNGATPAWRAAGRVQGDSGTTFNNVGTVNPQLFGNDIAVSDASPVTSIDFAYAGAGAGHACIFGLSGNNAGTTWTPLAVTGFTKDMVVAAGESSPTALTTATTASMDGGTANNGNTWYERGYYPNLPNSGLPAPGTVINSLDKPDHHYLMPASYSAPNAIYVDAANPIANVTLASPQNYSALSFLNATANGTNLIQCTMQYEDGTSEVNTFVAKDWFNGTPFAYRSDGRVSLNNRSLNNFNGGINPRLYEAEFVLGNTVSRITNVVMQWLAGGGNARCVVLAVSATAGALKPIFGLQPQNINTYDGNSVTFNAAIAGGTQPITYQWQKGNNGVFVNLTDGGNVSGSGTTNLTIAAASASDAADYRLIASNSAGSSISVVATLTILSTLPDVTMPGDPITAVGGAQPVGEEVIHVIDNMTQKYLNFGTGPNLNNPPFVGPAGFVVTPALGLTRVTGLRIYTANDTPDRDPADFVLEGSTDGGLNYTLITSNSLALPDGRNAGGAIPLDPLTQFLQQVLFPNPNSYTTYRLSVTRVKNNVAANSMQVAEVELLGAPDNSGIPLFTSQPASVRAYVGSGASFTISAIGNPDPDLQWQKGTNGVFVDLDDVGNISGSINPTLSINPVNFNDAADYRCLARNANGGATSTVARLTVISGLLDVTAPGDVITSFGGGSPVGEEAAHAIENVTDKHLNFGTDGNEIPPFAGPVGIVVTPAVGPTRVTGLRVFAANDAPERDPADFTLEGSTDGGATYTLFASGPLSLPAARNNAGLAIDPLTQSMQEVLFGNSVAYTSYRLTFAHVRNGVTANSCQFAEVELLGVPAPPAPVVILDFQPRTGGEGTLITITGSGFGNNPDDHCAILNVGGRFIDIEVLTASPTQLVARLGAIPPGLAGAPAQLMVGVGNGARVALCPEFHDVQVADGNWIWRGDAPDMAVAPGAFLIAATPAAPAPAAAALDNFHSPGPVNGMLMITLNKDWGVGSRFCILARVHAADTGSDTRIGSTTFTGVGNRFDCALRICDLLRKAFASHPERPLNVLCTVTTNGTAAVITLKLADGRPIDGGNIDILQKSPPPVIAGIWGIENSGLWRKEVRRRELARWYRCYEWRTIDSIWFERRAEGMWITREALETFTCSSHCIYHFPNGRIWIIWRTFSRADLVRFWVHYRFWWPGRLNPLLRADDPAANRTMMSMDDLQIVLPMTPADPNPSTPFNEAVMIVDENGQQHFQGQPGFEIPPDIAGNPNGFQIATTAQSTEQLPPAAQRIMDIPMPPMPGMAQLQPGVIIQWLVDKNGNVLVDHNNDGWPDPITSPHVLGGQKHQGLIAQPTGNAGNVLPVDTGNNQLQLYCWELDPNGEVRGASPGQIVIGPPADLNGDGVADGPIGAPVPADPTVRQLVVNGGQIQEQRDPTAKAVDLAVVEEAPPTDAQLAAMNANLGAQIPGFVPLQRPFILCISRIWMRRLWTIDRRYVFDTWFHHWTWQHRNHIVLTHQACRVWLTKVSLSRFSYAQHCFPFGLPATWRMFDLTQVRFFRVCFRVVVVGPNQVAFKIDQMYATLPQDPDNPNSPLMLLSTRGDENALLQEVPPPVLAGLQPDPLPVGPDGVFVEPIDPVAGTLDIGLGGTGVFDNRPLEARGMLPVTLGGNEDAANAPENNQLQLYCWALNPNGTIAQETYPTGGAAPAPAGPAAVPGVITLATTPTPALPSFDDGMGNMMDNPTMFTTTLMTTENEIHIAPGAPGFVVLTWEGGGTLQCADELLGNGPPTVWTDVPGAASGMSVNAAVAHRFYRLKR